MKIEGVGLNPQLNSVQPEKESVSNDVFQKILEKAKKTGDTESLRNATDDLEAVFLNMLMKTMRAAIPETEGIFKKSDAEKMFQDMLDQEYAGKMSKSGGIGISDMLFDQFQKNLYNNEDEKQISSFEMKG